MVLHEVLKYKELEKVVGLELDQQVVRTVFHRFGTQPPFDNDKVEWYFGDAAVALRALPRE
jgi:spermidine synthase